MEDANKELYYALSLATMAPRASEWRGQHTAWVVAVNADRVQDRYRSVYEAYLKNQLVKKKGAL